MVSRILMTCGGFALAFLGLIVAIHGSTLYGFVALVVGVALLTSSIPTHREDR